MELKTLHRLASAFEHIGGAELMSAAALVRVAASCDLDAIRPQDEHALFSELWGLVSRALDHADFDSARQDEVEALEAEMAGHVLFYRLARGWLMRSEGAPTEFPLFKEAIGDMSTAKPPPAELIQERRVSFEAGARVGRSATDAGPGIIYVATPSK